MHDYRTLLYSLDEKISITDFKVGNYDQDRDVSKVQEYLDQHHIVAHIDGGQNYHYKTYQISSKPYIYYTMGNTALLDRQMIAIVGPRKPSDYAARVLEVMMQELSHYNIVTISGMAEGVDEMVHRLSMQYQIPTIAVLGAGFGQMLRSARRHIVQEIKEAGGCVYSEFRLKQSATHYTYPQRNRIVAGYADAVVLPEAALESGSLITADYALAMNKPLYVTPNSIFTRTSQGSNELLQSGKAKAITDIPSWVQGLNLTLRKQSHETSAHLGGGIDLTEEECSVYHILIAHGTSMDINQMIKEINLEISQLQTILSMLEIYGIVRQVSVGVYMV